ncbi:unnamed protein product [Coregonus sp. 'balchen']|nr:unnamed protein product [Coregonus sp. 'balchen']
MIEVKSLFVSIMYKKHLQQDKEVKKRGKAGSWETLQLLMGRKKKGSTGGAAQSGSSAAAHWGPLQVIELY